MKKTNGDLCDVSMSSCYLKCFSPLLFRLVNYFNCTSMSDWTTESLSATFVFVFVDMLRMFTGLQNVELFAISPLFRSSY